MSEAESLHAELIAAIRDHRSAEYRLAKLLARMQDKRLYFEFGFSTLNDYARESLDLEPRKTSALLQIGRAIGDLPALDRAFEAGEVGWTKVREIVGIATPETEADWVLRAKEVTSRELERQVATTLVGERPPADPGEERAPARQRLVFEVASVDAQVIRDALVVLRAKCGRSDVDDGVLLAMLAQRALHDDPPAEAPEAYRKIVVECPCCSEVSGVGVEIDDTVAAEADCDHEAVVRVPGPFAASLQRPIPPRTRRAVLARDGRRCVVPGCSCRIWLHVHHLRPRSQGGGHDLVNLVTLCSAHHRQVHLGLLAIWRDAVGVLHFRFPDGRRKRRGPRGRLFASTGTTAARPATRATERPP